MISNNKKSSIKSLNNNNMPLFDSVEDENEVKEIDSVRNNNINILAKNKQSESDKPKSLSSLDSTSLNKTNFQNEQQSKFSQRQHLNNVQNTINKTVSTTPTLKPKTQSETLNSISGNISLGSYLQEARVKSGYSMNQVAMITKLNIHYIEAIERDDYKNTPPLIYIKAYVKKLATLYAIDAEKALSLLKPLNNGDKQIPSKLIQELQETKQVNQKDEAKIKMILQISIVVLLGIILICLIVGLIYWFSSGSSNNESSTSNNITTSSISKTNNVSTTSTKPLATVDKTEISKEMENLIVPQSIKLTELPIPQK